MADEGFNALTMRKIAEAVEYSPATIYLYFENRDDIALQLVRDGFAALLEHLAPAMAVADPLERLRVIGRRYVAFSRACPQMYRLIFMEDERFAEHVMARLKEEGGDGGAFDMLVTTVQTLVEKGVFRKLPADLIAGLFAAAVHGIASLKLSCPTYPFSGEVEGPTEVMLDALVRGFRTSTQPN